MGAHLKHFQASRAILQHFRTRASPARDNCKVAQNRMGAEHAILVWGRCPPHFKGLGARAPTAPMLPPPMQQYVGSKWNVKLGPGYYGMCSVRRSRYKCAYSLPLAKLSPNLSFWSCSLYICMKNARFSTNQTRKVIGKYLIHS